MFRDDGCLVLQGQYLSLYKNTGKNTVKGCSEKFQISKNPFDLSFKPKILRDLKAKVCWRCQSTTKILHPVNGLP